MPPVFTVRYDPSVEGDLVSFLDEMGRLAEQRYIGGGLEDEVQIRRSVRDEVMGYYDKCVSAIEEAIGGGHRGRLESPKPDEDGVLRSVLARPFTSGLQAVVHCEWIDGGSEVTVTRITVQRR